MALADEPSFNLTDETAIEREKVCVIAALGLGHETIATLGKALARCAHTHKAQLLVTGLVAPIAHRLTAIIAFFTLQHVPITADG